MKPGAVAIVGSRRGSDADYSEGDPCKAELVEQLRPGSEFWFVRFLDGRDEQGNKITGTRLRRFIQEA